MMKARRSIQFISGVFLSLAFTSCFDLLGEGSNTLVSQKANAARTKKAWLFLRGAGATVADSYQLSITDYDQPFDTSAVGNTFTCDDNHGKSKLDSAAVQFSWKNDSTLAIDYDSTLRTFIRNDRTDFVKIVYIAR